MKTGDIIRDDRGRSFQVGQPLGRGLWGKTFAARDEADGSQVALKVSLQPVDLPGQDEVLVAACREIASEQARLLESTRLPGLMRLEARFQHEGASGLVLPLYRHGLMQPATTSLQETLATCLDITRRLIELSPVIAFHGNLTPTNVFWSADRSDIALSDPVTPTFRRYFSALRQAAGDLQPFRPPEVRSALGQVPIGVATDTYALAMMLFRAAISIPGTGGLERMSPSAGEGLDKQTLAVLKDRVLNRLKGEPSNPRFHTRLAGQLSTMLNRALSAQTSPSPPYRFRTIREFDQRCATVLALVHPTITHVGRLILNERPGSAGFQTDDTVSFSCTVAASTGVDNHEEIACGLAVFDTDRGERLRDVACTFSVTRHPSGRFRFGFQVSDLPPGAYRVRVAFAIRESGEPPSTAESPFTVRPAPGYVPPRADLPPAPIPFNPHLQQTRQPPPTHPGDVIAGPFPARGTSPSVATTPAPQPILPQQPEESRPPRVAAAHSSTVVDDRPLQPHDTSTAEPPIPYPHVRAGRGRPPEPVAREIHHRPAPPPTTPAPRPTRPSVAPPPPQPAIAGATWSPLPEPLENLIIRKAEPESEPKPPSVADELEDDRDWPLGEQISDWAHWLVAKLSGDAYLMFIAIAVVVIVVLLMILMAVS